MLLEETETATLQRLGTLTVRAPLDGIAHGRHGCGCFERLFLVPLSDPECGSIGVKQGKMGSVVN